MTRRLGICLLLTVPVVIVCHLFGLLWPWSSAFGFLGGVVMGAWWSWRGR